MKDENNALNPNHIALMDVYLQEWCHRDTLLWTQVFKYFFSALVVIILPNAVGGLGIEFGNIPTAVFRIVGILISLVFLYVALAYSKRLEASGKTYQNMIDMLPPEYRRVSLRNNPATGKNHIRYAGLFRHAISFIVCGIMFLGLILLAIVLLLFG